MSTAASPLPSSERTVALHFQPEKNNHGLPHNPFIALVAPRPIGWISTLNEHGSVNLAPYSFFNAVSSRPPMVMFSSSTPKDSRRNAEATGEFVVNLATYDLREEMGATSDPHGPAVSEPEVVGLEMSPSLCVRTPRVARARAALECRYDKTVELTDREGKPISSAIVIGEVIGIYIDDALIVDGKVDITRARPIARLGYKDYSVVDAVFPMIFPKGH
jgi:flavin reductase (DIM6/NTAB) family NADH-FMN oxidoreductase RutF